MHYPGISPCFPRKTVCYPEISFHNPRILPHDPGIMTHFPRIAIYNPRILPYFSRILISNPRILSHFTKALYQPSTLSTCQQISAFYINRSSLCRLSTGNNMPSSLIMPCFNNHCSNSGAGRKPSTLRTYSAS